MKTRYLFALLPLVGMHAHAAPEDMTVTVWDPGCNHTLTTNHFVLPAGQSTMEIYVDLSACTDEQLGSLLFFGYHTTKNRSRQLSSKDKVSLQMLALDQYGNIAENLSSRTGSILTELAPRARGIRLIARNDDRNKEIKIRLRSQLIAP